MKKRDGGFRAWFYFRNGWSLYFAFIFAAVNTLTVTYYLAIEKIPILTNIFPTFAHYIVIMTMIGIPLLVLVGYAHWKRSGARKAEIDISYEVDPYKARTLVNSEMLLTMNANLLTMLTKIINEQKLSPDEVDEIKKSQDKISEYMKNRTFTNKLDLKYLKTESQENL